MENNEELNEDLQNETTENQEVVDQEEQKIEEQPKANKNEDGDYVIDFSKFNSESKEQEEEEGSSVSEEEPSNEESVTEEPSAEDEASVLQEITEEEVQERAEELEEKLEEAVEQQAQTGVELPENIQKVVDFMNDTGGSLEDYVKLNQDYSSLNENQLLREYYENTKPHLDKEDIDLLMEDFSYDEELDDERDIRKAKIAKKEELAKAKKHLEGLKNQYYDEIKAGSRLTPEQQEAVNFFNRYKKENQETSQLAEKQKTAFLNKTEKLFSNDFKGFDYQVGDKKYRFNVKNPSEVKNTQSDINNFIKKFLNENNEMSDAAGYHKSLFTAMNADAVAKHFYEQGKADAIKESTMRTKNINMDARGVHGKVPASNGFTVRAVNGNDVSDFKIKIRK